MSDTSKKTEPAEERPEWITCIRDTHADRKGKAWCGAHIFGFAFVDADHAAQNGRNESRLVACPECVAAVVKALGNGHADS